jgi:hypothetical protein
MCVCVHFCMYVRVCVCMCVCLHTNIYIYIYIYMQMCTHIHAHTNAHTYKDTISQHPHRCTNTFGFFPCFDARDALSLMGAGSAWITHSMPALQCFGCIVLRIRRESRQVRHASAFRVILCHMTWYDVM